MIKAQKHKFFDFIFFKYLYKIIKSNFHSVNVIDTEKFNIQLAKLDKTKNIIFIQNHAYWWDGFIAYILNEKYFGYNYYVMMLEKQLKKFTFFKRIGAFSIEPTSPKSIIESINYAVELLQNNTKSNNSRNSLLIFPQGKTQPDFIQNYDIKNGVFEILKKYFKENDKSNYQNIDRIENEIQICFIYNYIYNGNNQKPELFTKLNLFIVNSELKISKIENQNFDKSIDKSTDKSNDKDNHEKFTNEFIHEIFTQSREQIENVIKDYELNKLRATDTKNFETIIKGKSRTSD